MPAKDPSLPRLDFDFLEFDDDLALLDGIPFCGIVCSTYPDGMIEFERTYRDGLPDGMQEDWYPNGQLFSRSISIRGFGASESWTWYPDGTARSYRRNGQDGRLVELSSWDATGNQIDPALQRPVNEAGVLAELFDRAVVLKKAGRLNAASLAGSDGKP